MLNRYSVKDLYPLALAEGEGMGTAYEYYVKRRVLDRFLPAIGRPRSVLIAGLPEKYGASLDFMLLASEIGANVTVVDDRQHALERLRNSLGELEKWNSAPRIGSPAAILLTDLDNLSSIRQRFDLVLTSEVVQRLTPESRASFVGRLRHMSRALAIFSPNADNEAHNTRSGLAGLRLDELRRLTDGQGIQVAGYIDMPPFPPGITRSAEQREVATSGRFEAWVMWGLGRYASVERFIPPPIRRRQSHIVFSLTHS